MFFFLVNVSATGHIEMDILRVDSTPLGGGGGSLSPPMAGIDVGITVESEASGQLISDLSLVILHLWVQLRNSFSYKFINLIKTFSSTCQFKSRCSERTLYKPGLLLTFFHHSLLQPAISQVDVFPHVVTPVIARCIALLR